MGKRKSITKNRLQWMNDAKKRAKEMAQEQLQVGEEIEEDLQHINGDGEVENDEENEQEKEEAEEQMEEVVAQEQVLNVYEIEKQSEEEDEMDEDGIPPAIIYIDGIAIPTRDLADPRNGDGLVLELDNEEDDPYLAKFNGDYHDLHQIVGAIWENANGETQMTIGHTNRHPRTWAQQANRAAIRAGLTMNVNKAFSFKLYVRTWLLAEKVKGLARAATECIHKREAVNYTNALVPFHRYIESKMFKAIEHLPPANQEAYLRGKGWRINIEEVSE